MIFDRRQRIYFKVLNIEKERKRVRKDISCYKDIKEETWYMFDKSFCDMASYNAKR